jgi:hypothetical protein
MTEKMNFFDRHALRARDDSEEGFFRSPRRFALRDDRLKFSFIVACTAGD